MGILDFLESAVDYVIEVRESNIEKREDDRRRSIPVDHSVPFSKMDGDVDLTLLAIGFLNANRHRISSTDISNIEANISNGFANLSAKDRAIASNKLKKS